MSRMHRASAGYRAPKGPGLIPRSAHNKIRGHLPTMVSIIHQSRNFYIKLKIYNKLRTACMQGADAANTSRSWS